MLAVSLRFEADEDYLKNVVGQNGMVVIGGEAPQGWGQLTCKVRNQPPSIIDKRSVASAFYGRSEYDIKVTDSYTLTGESSVDLYLEVGLAYDDYKKTVIVHKETIPKGKIDYSINLHDLIRKGQSFINQ